MIKIIFSIILSVIPSYYHRNEAGFIIYTFEWLWFKKQWTEEFDTETGEIIKENKKDHKTDVTLISDTHWEGSVHDDNSKTRSVFVNSISSLIKGNKK